MAYADSVRERTHAWQQAHVDRLKSLDVDDLPKRVIRELSEDLLQRFADIPLLDRYDVYQRLMDYWVDVMQDDVYLIAADGWLDAAQPRAIIKDKDRKIEESPDLVIGSGKSARKYKMDLLPPELIVAHYFADEQAAIDALQAEQDNAARELEEFIEQQSGEDSLLDEAMNDKGKITNAGVKDRLKAIKEELDSGDERDALMRCLASIDVEMAAGKAVKEAQTALDKHALACYSELSEDEIKSLAVYKKWFATIAALLETEVHRIIRQLAERIQDLADRYARPL